MADTARKTDTPEITPELVMELMARNEALIKELEALKEQKSAPTVSAPVPQPVKGKGGKDPFR